MGHNQAYHPRLLVPLGFVSPISVHVLFSSAIVRLTPSIRTSESLSTSIRLGAMRMAPGNLRMELHKHLMAFSGPLPAT